MPTDRSAASDGRDPRAVPALLQGGYYVATGVLPLVSMRAFEAITGPKEAPWLVKTFGLMVTVIGGVLLVAAAKKRITPEISALAVGSAVALAAADSWYAGKRRISPVYFADAVAELALGGLWAVASKHQRGTVSGGRP